MSSYTGGLKFVRSSSDDHTPVPAGSTGGEGEATTELGGTADTNTSSCDMFVRRHAPDVEPAGTTSTARCILCGDKLEKKRECVMCGGEVGDKKSCDKAGAKKAPHGKPERGRGREGHPGQAAGGEVEACAHDTLQVSNHSPIFHSEEEDSATDQQAAPPSPERTPSYWMVFMCVCIHVHICACMCLTYTHTHTYPPPHMIHVCHMRRRIHMCVI